ncbi:hypothetical protein GGI35DRAFT_220383 [Trichoderma velutinum]
MQGPIRSAGNDSLQALHTCTRGSKYTVRYSLFTTVTSTRIKRRTCTVTLVVTLTHSVPYCMYFEVGFRFNFFFPSRLITKATTMPIRYDCTPMLCAGLINKSKCQDDSHSANHHSIEKKENGEATGPQKRETKKAPIFTTPCVKRNFIPLHVGDEFPL